MWDERGCGVIWETWQLHSFGDGPRHFHIQKEHLSPLQVSCHWQLRPSPAICHWEDVWIWFKRSWQLSTHPSLSIVKHSFPSAAFVTRESFTLDLYFWQESNAKTLPIMKKMKALMTAKMFTEVLLRVYWSLTLHAGPGTRTN